MRLIACEEIIERMRKNSDNSDDSLLNSQVVAGIKINRWKKNEMGQLVESKLPARQRKSPFIRGFEFGAGTTNRTRDLLITR
jgi:hypothetical protein